VEPEVISSFRSLDLKAIFVQFSWSNGHWCRSSSCVGDRTRRL